MEKRSVGQDRHSQYPQGADWQGQGSQEVDWQGVGSQGQNREGGRTYYTGLSSIKEGEKVRYYLYNHRGDTVLVTGGDGEIIHNLSYEAYGKATDKLGYPAGSVNIETGGGSGGDAWGGGSGSGGGAGGDAWGGGAGATSGATSGGVGSSGGASGGGRDSVFPQLFAGAYGIRYDAKTNLHYMRYRWYSQTQMRFVSLDLIRNANRYSYTNGNPIMYVDPTGLKEERKIEAFITVYKEDKPKRIPVILDLKINQGAREDYPAWANEKQFQNFKGYDVWVTDENWVDTTNKRGNCIGYAATGDQGFYINPHDSDDLFNSDHFEAMKNGTLREGDIIWWKDAHAATVFVIYKLNVLIIEKDGHGPILILPVAASYKWGMPSQIFRPTGKPYTITLKYYNNNNLSRITIITIRSPYRRMLQQHGPLYKELVEKGTITNVNLKVDCK